MGIVLLILNESISGKDRLSGTLHDTAVSPSVSQRQKLDMLLGIRQSRPGGSARGLVERFTADLPARTIGSKA